MSLFDDIMEAFQIENAYKKWEDYRGFVTEMLIHNSDMHFMKSEGPTLLIVGAGAADDVDLGRLSEHFSEITIMDFDESLLDKAIEKYNLKENQGLKKEVFSVNGINEESLRYFTDKLRELYQRTLPYLEYEDVKDRYIEDFELRAIAILEDIYKDRDNNAKKEGALTGWYDESFQRIKDKYDYVFAAGLHSQLTAYFSYIMRVFENHFRDLLGKEVSFKNFEEALVLINEEEIPRINSRLISRAVISTIFGNELSKKGEETERVEGAYECIMDIRGRHTSENVSELYCDWPFDMDRDIVYNMVFQKLDQF